MEQLIESELQISINESASLKFIRIGSSHNLMCDFRFYSIIFEGDGKKLDL